MTLNDEQLRQRLARLADHARAEPTIRLGAVDAINHGRARPRWTAAGAVAVAAALLVIVVIAQQRPHGSGPAVRTGPLTSQSQPGSGLTAPPTTSSLPSTTRTVPTTLSRPATTLHPALDPPDASGPVAGGCSQAQGTTGQVTIAADLVPQPRCLVIRHDQRLSITNNTNNTIAPTLGTHLKATIQPGHSATFPDPVGTDLAPGVHRLVFTSASAADIWVDAVCRGPGPVDCRTP